MTAIEKKLILLDFDGTICDSENHMVTALQELSSLLFFNRPSKEDIQMMKSLKTRESLKHLGISPWKLPLVVILMRHKLSKKINEFSCFEGLKLELEKLSKSTNLGILSTNSKSNIELFLSNNNINSFRFIEGKASFLNKAKKINKIINEQGYSDNLNMVYYVGDETRDIEAANHLGINSVAVGWGYNNIERLNSLKPTISITKPSEFSQYF